MTTPSERTRSLVFARELLEVLACSPHGTYPETLQHRAQVVLRHYPSLADIEDIAATVDAECKFPTLAPITDR